MLTRSISIAAFGSLIAMTSFAAPNPGVTIAPKEVRPGDPVLVMVADTREAPNGNANGTPLHFFAARGGWQAVFAVPLGAKPEVIAIEVAGEAKATVRVRAFKFPETDVIVEDELANPPKADRDRIDADNNAIIEAVGKSKGDTLFSRPFQRAPGEVTSTFGEWRTFNDGHRSQHLGLDLTAREGSKVKAINAGTVVLVRDGFLTGNLVVISHGAGIASAYYHLSKVTVGEGDAVAQGAEIGLAGHTGRTTGPHMHVSVRVPGGFVDPASFLKLPLAPRSAMSAHR